MNEVNQQQETSFVSGYYNPHAFPIHLFVSELGRQLTLESRQFIVDVRGCVIDGKPGTRKVKINDPIFAPYVKPLGLAAENSKVAVPVERFPRPAAQSVQSHQFEYAGSTSIKQDVNGKITNAAEIYRDQGAKQASAGSIMAFSSVEEAIKAGVLRRAGKARDDDGGMPQQVIGKKSPTEAKQELQELLDVGQPRLEPIQPVNDAPQLAPPPVIQRNRAAAENIGPKFERPIVPQHVKPATAGQVAIPSAAQISVPAAGVPEEIASTLNSFEGDESEQIPGVDLNAIVQKVAPTPQPAAPITEKTAEGTVPPVVQDKPRRKAKSADVTADFPDPKA